MKIKIDQIRTYDDAGYRRRAACLCFKSDCESEILLVSSSRFHDLWIVPGGGLEPGEDPATTAVREVNEEAGVVGKLGRLLDVFENKDRKTRTYVYILVVEQLNEDYEDAKGIGRLRKWFSLSEANSKLSQHKPVQQEYIDRLIQDKDHQQRASLCASIPVNSTNMRVHPHHACITTNVCSKCCLAYRQSVCLNGTSKNSFMASKQIGEDELLIENTSIGSNVPVSLRTAIDGNVESVPKNSRGMQRMLMHRTEVDITPL